MSQLRLWFRLKSGVWIAALLFLGALLGIAIAIPLSLNLIPASVVCDGKSGLCWRLRLEKKMDFRDL